MALQEKPPNREEEDSFAATIRALMREFDKRDAAQAKPAVVEAREEWGQPQPVWLWLPGGGAIPLMP